MLLFCFGYMPSVTERLFNLVSFDVFYKTVL